MSGNFLLLFLLLPFGHSAIVFLDLFKDKKKKKKIWWCLEKKSPKDDQGNPVASFPSCFLESRRQPITVLWLVVAQISTQTRANAGEHGRRIWMGNVEFAWRLYRPGRRHSSLSTFPASAVFPSVPHIRRKVPVGGIGPSPTSSATNGVSSPPCRGPPQGWAMFPISN